MVGHHRPARGPVPDRPGRRQPHTPPRVIQPLVGERDATVPADGQGRFRNATRQRSVRSSGDSLPRGRPRVCRRVRSSNGAHTVHRWAKLPKPCRPRGPWRVEPLAWWESRRPPSWLTPRCTGPLASPALLLPCSSFAHPTNSRRACRQFCEARRRQGSLLIPAAAGTKTASLPRSAPLRHCAATTAATHPGAARVPTISSVAQHDGLWSRTTGASCTCECPGDGAPRTGRGALAAAIEGLMLATAARSHGRTQPNYPESPAGQP